MSKITRYFTIAVCNLLRTYILVFTLTCQPFDSETYEKAVNLHITLPLHCSGSPPPQFQVSIITAFSCVDTVWITTELQA